MKYSRFIRSDGSDSKKRVVRHTKREPRRLKSSGARKVFRRHNFVLALVLRGIAVVLVGVAVYSLLFRSGWFDISSVEIRGAKQFVNPTDVQALVEGAAIGENIILFNPEGVEKNVKKNFLSTKGVVIKKVYPSKVKVFVEERSPLALLSPLYSEDLFMVDDEGFVLGLVRDGFTDLPKVEYDGDILVGNFIDQNVVPVYLDLLISMKREDLKISSVSINRKYSNIYLEEGTLVYVGNDKDIQSAFKTLSSLVKKLTLEGKKIAKIDLRYDKVIVLYD
jgi:cell division septal protein FtsQ